MEVYSDAQVSEVTGDLGGFELALDKEDAPQRKTLLFVYEGAADGDGIPLTVTTNGNSLLITGTWTEHLTEHPSKKEIVPTHSVRITAAVTPKMLRGTIAIQGLEIANPDSMKLKRTNQIWICRKRSPG
jgi:hypothetical protein